jgi:hypothetical protein
MARDSLDDLLDCSAPASPRVPTAEFRAMVGEARKAAPRSGHTRLWLAVGVVAALLAGGTGVAYAADGLRWTPAAQHPIVAVSFTMSNGLQCEYRQNQYIVGPGADPVYAKTTKLLHEWYRSGDAAVEARALVPAYRKWLPYDLRGAETLDTMPAAEAERLEWQHEETAWTMAIGQAEADELTRHGIPFDTPFVDGTITQQIKCYDNNGQLYVPGAGA